MSGPWIGVPLSAVLVLSSATSASSAGATLQIGVTVQRSCAVTRVPSAGTVRVECTRSRGPAPMLVVEEESVIGPDARRSASDDWRRVEILF
jgi:hypothetical protein